ncbi:MAG: transcriptional repressor [Dehalococcoidia bacterium]|nr:transcriptional repressor [Dehalococcoidia bacterium]MDD5493529.1 transcriptional repressor [Dehalococcoidia bacterium]
MVKKTQLTKLMKPGSRVTGQRLLIYKIISDGGRHLDADEIYRRARQTGSRISLATVYRTLQKFKQLGIIDELHFGQDHHHYETKQEGEHYHLVCSSCGKVIEFAYPLYSKIKKDVMEARDFKIVAAEVNMTGFCKRCRK